MAGRTTRSFTTTDNPTNPVHFRFTTTRVDNYPDDEVAATTAPISTGRRPRLSRDVALCLPTTVHACHRSTRHHHYRKKARKIPPRKEPRTGPTVYIEPIVSGDVIEQVMNMNPLSRVTISLRPRDVQAYINGLPTNKSHCSHGSGLRKPNRTISHLQSIPSGPRPIQRQNISALSRFCFANRHAQTQETHSQGTL